MRFASTILAVFALAATTVVATAPVEARIIIPTTTCPPWTGPTVRAVPEARDCIRGRCAKREPVEPRILCLQ
ncbi:unnamed protein product [Mycena citricolor]|uniref:Uncharacterized protein n=1 Tax=Mycena citricolor TaxID=2018698 RepID=A0AAD2H4G3_9AGAR|nr:unnamed protein product [Mycena citricolor]CAK5273709.1 unnamed protein product [Mycena citricolor]